MKFRQNPDTLELEPMDDAAYVAIHHVMPEIQPYQSMKTGEWITSRAQHQEHLRKHDCFEVGNEVNALMRQPKHDTSGIKESYIKQFMGMRHEEFKRAVKAEADFVKWNSRGLDKA